MPHDLSPALNSPARRCPHTMRFGNALLALMAAQEDVRAAAAAMPWRSIDLQPLDQGIGRFMDTLE